MSISEESKKYDIILMGKENFKCIKEALSKEEFEFLHSIGQKLCGDNIKIDDLIFTVMPEKCCNNCGFHTSHVYSLENDKKEDYSVVETCDCENSEFLGKTVNKYNSCEKWLDWEFLSKD